MPPAADEDSELEEGEIPPTPPRQVSPPAVRHTPSRRRTPSLARKRKRSRSADRRRPSPRPINGRIYPRSGSPRPADQPQADGRLSQNGAKFSPRSSDEAAIARWQSSGGGAPRSRSRQPQRRRTPSPRRRRRSEPRNSADSLAADVQRLTTDTGVPQAMKSLAKVCDKLSSALRKLEEFASLAAAGSNSAEQRASLTEQLSALAGGAFAGLRAVHVVLGTAQGQATADGAARDLFAAAMRLRTHLFSASQANTLEGWVRTTKALRSVQPAAVATAIGAAAEEPSGGAAPDDAADADPAAGRAEPGGNSAADEAADVSEAPPAPPPPPPRSPPPAAERLEGIPGLHSDSAPAAAPDAVQLLAGYDPFAQPPAEGEADPAPHAAQPAAATVKHSGITVVKGPRAASRDPTPPAAQPVQNGGASSDVSAVPAASSVVLGDVNSLLQRRQLCLVLDLDHTLVNSTRFSEVGPDMELRLRGLQNMPNAVERHLHELPHIQMWTKLRPGVQDFLARAAQCFELWIHTNGSRSYAMAVVELLDPTGKLFGPRLIAQGSGDPAQIDLAKRLKAGLEGRDMVAIIVDDTSSVWSEHPENLFLVEPYIFFPGQRSNVQSLLETERDEVAERGMLRIAMDALLRVHARVFDALSTPPARGPDGRLVYERWDVPHILQLERSEVLHGVVIMFSRIIPLDEQPTQHALWLRAESFGAACTTHMSDAVTHLVTNTQHTLKAQWARENGKFIVTAAWLKCSCTLWQRAPEADFPVPLDAAPP